MSAPSIYGEVMVHRCWGSEQSQDQISSLLTRCMPTQDEEREEVKGETKRAALSLSLYWVAINGVSTDWSSALEIPEHDNERHAPFVCSMQAIHASNSADLLLALRHPSTEGALVLSSRDSIPATLAIR